MAVRKNSAIVATAAIALAVWQGECVHHRRAALFSAPGTKELVNPGGTALDASRRLG